MCKNTKLRAALIFSERLYCFFFWCLIWWLYCISCCIVVIRLTKLVINYAVKTEIREWLYFWCLFVAAIFSYFVVFFVLSCMLPVHHPPVKTLPETLLISYKNINYILHTCTRICMNQISITSFKIRNRIFLLATNTAFVGESFTKHYHAKQKIRFTVGRYVHNASCITNIL